MRSANCPRKTCTQKSNPNHETIKKIYFPIRASPIVLVECRSQILMGTRGTIKKILFNPNSCFTYSSSIKSAKKSSRYEDRKQKKNNKHNLTIRVSWWWRHPSASTASSRTRRRSRCRQSSALTPDNCYCFQIVTIKTITKLK